MKLTGIQCELFRKLYGLYGKLLTAGTFGETHGLVSKLLKSIMGFRIKKVWIAALVTPTSRAEQGPCTLTDPHGIEVVRVFRI